MTNQSILTTANLNLIDSSVVTDGEMEFALAKFPEGRKFIVVSGSDQMDDFEGERSQLGQKTLFVGPLSPANTVFLRNHLKWTKPSLLGLKTSAGMGDRIGLATPGHIRAIRSVGGKLAPILAQQSMREMARTNRSPQQVLDDATWGVFSESWQGGFGADADHLKTPQDIDVCLNVGFTFFTIDPGAFVDNRAENASILDLQAMFADLPDIMKPTKSGLMGKTFTVEDLKIHFDETTLLKAAVKYGKAIHHVWKMYEHLSETAGGRPFEFEVSVDETDQPTTHAEHYYVAHELKRLGVKWVSLAPRFIGSFEKGVDYIGDVDSFEKDIAGHASIARELGPYKLSLHSGSDKFSIYPAAMRQTRGLVHLKTAGTSYLEALNTISSTDPDLLRKIYVFARERFESDKQSYHISATLEHAPDPDSVTDWSSLLNQFDAREILHVTFGSVLMNTEIYPRLFKLLQDNSELYAANLEKHFIHHLSSFSS
ncbi:MAG: tagaturonate epimerase family protein [Anaerolineaceae bacterium]